MANSKRKCGGCGEYFRTDGKTFPGAVSWCSVDCGVAVGVKRGSIARQKAQKEKRKADKERIKTKAEWAKEAQAAFNKYIRLRDRDAPCISCQRYHAGQYHAGHYRSVGSCPELRFEELNVHKQCSACNNHLSGNIVNYRINLLAKVGEVLLNWLEGNHEPKRYTVEDLKYIKKQYAAKAAQEAK